MTRNNRRSFLKSTSAAATAATMIPYIQTASADVKAVSAIDKFSIGCIGLGGMGSGDATAHARFGDIVAVCDVDANHAQRARDNERIGKGKADVFTDYRKLLERKDINVVSVVTPDHWHTKIAIEALQAGKHVFCQKPLTLTLEENLRIRAACKANPNLVFFVGTQQRSSRNLFLRAVNMCHKGLLGDLKKITCGINGSPTGGPFEKTPPPANLDWDMWLGQAPKVDYIKQRCHNDFRWWYEYSGGKFTDWGAHHIDIAIWAAKLTEQGSGPVSVDGSDCKHPVEMKNGQTTQDNYFNTAHYFNIVHKMPNGLEIVVSSEGRNGLLIEGSKGRIFVSREKIEGLPIEEAWDKDAFTDDDLATLYKSKPFEGHKENFYRCIREGGLPVSDVYSHLQTMNMCHLSAIAGRLGRQIKWNAATEQIEGDEVAAAMQARVQRAGFEVPKVG
ncbi:MAG: Gfo/Idh/MocA family oxidoreductase [Pirellula sp.]